MNYISYFKKQGFKKCSPFFITEGGYGDNIELSKNGKKYTTNLINIYNDRNGDYKMVDRDIDIFINCKKDLQLNKINNIGNVSGIRGKDKWNQLMYKNDEDVIYIYIVKSHYNIILTDENFSYIIHDKGRKLTELESGIFNSRLERMMGEYQYRNYLINKIIN